VGYISLDACIRLLLERLKRGVLLDTKLNVARVLLTVILIASIGSSQDRTALVPIQTLLVFLGTAAATPTDRAVVSRARPSTVPA